MSAPPNQGSSFGRAVNDNILFESIWGISGQELANGFDDLELQLAAPDFEFGILAGVMTSNLVRNPLLDGPNDLVVTVEESKLAGIRDFRTVNSTHTRIMNQHETLQYVHRFLKVVTLNRNQPVLPQVNSNVTNAFPQTGRLWYRLWYRTDRHCYL